VSLIEPEPTNVVGGIGLGIGTEDDAEMRRWAKLADDGFDLRSGPGQRFARDPEAKTGAYKAMNIAQKAEFRKQWSKNIYQSILKVKVKSEAWSKIDISKSTSMPFTCIVREEGNDDAAMSSAVHYVQACQAMAGVWKKWNLMTKRLEFLFMRQEVHETFEQSWKVFEEHQQGPGHQGPGQPGPGGGENAVTRSTEAATGKQKGQMTASKTKPKGAEDPKPKGPELKPKTPDGKKSPFEVALVDAQITRKNYMAVTKKAALVTENILTNKAWEWARGYYQEEIMKLTSPIKALATTGVRSHFLDARAQGRQ
jgi:hypothetical protein